MAAACTSPPIFRKRSLRGLLPPGNAEPQLGNKKSPISQTITVSMNIPSTSPTTFSVKSNLCHEHNAPDISFFCCRILVILYDTPKEQMRIDKV